MLLVNFLGGFQVTPAWLKHHDAYCSYADTIMPQFFFAVGFAYRWTFDRRYQQVGCFAAYRRVVTRLLGLFLLAMVVYGLGPEIGSWHALTLQWPEILARFSKREFFQTLTHIGMTSLWITPVIRSSLTGRVAWGCFSAGLHVILSLAFYFDWCWQDPRVIDGGPLGFLTWSIPALAGTVASDFIRTERVGSLIKIGIFCSLVGWGLSLLAIGEVSDLWRTNSATVASAAFRLPFAPIPPDEPLNYWMMSQRGGTASYLMFASGWSLLVYALFYEVCDRLHWGVPMFRTFGSNALAAYLLHDLVQRAFAPIAPTDSPWPFVVVLTVVFLLVNYVLIRGLERQHTYLRL